MWKSKLSKDEKKELARQIGNRVRSSKFPIGSGALINEMATFAEGRLQSDDVIMAIHEGLDYGYLKLTHQRELVWNEDYD